MDQFQQAMKVGTKCREWLDRVPTHELKMQVLAHLTDYYQRTEAEAQQQNEGEKPPF